MYREADESAARGPENPLQNRLFFHLSHKFDDHDRCVASNLTTDTPSLSLSLSLSDAYSDSYSSVLIHGLVTIQTLLSPQADGASRSPARRDARPVHSSIDPLSAQSLSRGDRHLQARVVEEQSKPRAGRVHCSVLLQARLL